LLFVLAAELPVIGQGFGPSRCAINIDGMQPPLSLAAPLKVVVKEGEKLPGLSENIQAELKSVVPRRRPGVASTLTTIEVIPQLGRVAGRDNQKGPTPHIQTLSVTWRLLEGGSGRVLASDTVRENSPDFPVRIPKPSDSPEGSADTRLLEQRIFSLMFQSIKPRFQPRPQTTEVYLAQGKLSPGCDLGKSGRWKDALDFFVRVPVFSKPEDDSYRLYNTGIADEVLAYDEWRLGEAKASLQHFAESSRFLSDAVRLNPGEKTFSSAQARVTEWQAYVNAR